MIGKCKLIPDAPGKRNTPSLLFTDLQKITKSRWDAISLWAASQTETFKKRYPTLLKDENGEPKVFENSHFLTADGKQVPILASAVGISDDVNSSFVRNMYRFLAKKLKGVSEAFISKMNSIGLDHAITGKSWKGIKRGLIDLRSVYGVEDIQSNGVRTFSYLFDKFLTPEQKETMLGIYGIKIKEATREQIDNVRYLMTLDYLAWKARNIKGEDKFSSRVFEELKENFDGMFNNTIALDEYFALIDRGIFTANIPVHKYIADTQDLILNIQNDFGTEYDSLLDAVQRFREASVTLRELMMSYAYSMNTADNGDLFFYTREESESQMKQDLSEELDAIQKEVIDAFGTDNPDPAGKTPAQIALIKDYYDMKVLYENFDKLVNLLYPGRKTKQIDQYDTALIEELEIEEEMVNINAETIGGESLNSETTTSAAVKDFLATIKRPDGSYIRPRYAYMLAAKLLKGIDTTSDELFGRKSEVEQRVKQLGGKGSDADHVARALLSLHFKSEQTNLHTDKQQIPVGELKGEFLNYHFFRMDDGRMLRRNPGERSLKYYRRIANEFGLTNQQVAVMGQRFVANDLLNTIVSHFSSLKEANYHFMEKIEKNHISNFRYRPSKTMGIATAISEAVLEKINEAVGDGKFKKIWERVLEEDLTEKQSEKIKEYKNWIPENYRRLLRITALLRELGLPGEADYLSAHPEISREDGILVGKIYNDILGGVKRIYGEGSRRGSLEKHEAAVTQYEKRQKKYAALTPEEISAALPRVWEVLDNQRKQRAERNERDKAEKRKKATGGETLVEKIEKAVEAATSAAMGEKKVLGYEDLTPTEKLVYDARQNKTRPQLDVKEDINSMLSNISILLTRNNDSQKPASIFSRGRSKKYTLHNSSNAWVVMDWIKNRTEIMWQKDLEKLQKRFPYLAHKMYKDNIFLSGLNKVLDWHDFDYTKTVDWKNDEDSIVYTEERLKEFFNRVFNGQFLDVIRFGTGTPTYVQSLPTISNRPTTFSVKVNVLNKQEVIKGLVQTIRQMKQREDGLDILGYNADSTVNFRVLDPYVKQYGSIKAIPEESLENIATEIYEVEFEKMAMKLAEKFVEMKVPLHKDTVSVGLIKMLEPRDQDKVSKLLNHGQNETQATKRGTQGTEYSFTAEDLLPIMKLFVSNNYLNSYQLNQLVVGDMSFFKNGADVVKRSGGAHSPGQIGRVHARRGLPLKYTTLVVQDPVVLREGMEATLKRLGIEGEALQKLMKLYPKGYDLADGFGVMLPKRRRDLIKGFGTSYGVTHIAKPAHYEIDDRGIPRMIKYSSMELSDELCEQFPKLRILRDNLEALGVDEMVFQSAVKVGSPKKLMTLEDLFVEGYGENLKNIRESAIADIEAAAMYDAVSGENTAADVVIPEFDGVLSLSNLNYRLQHNPYHDLEGSVANPTQLSYFLNVLGTNVARAEQVYNAMGKIIERRLTRLLEGGDKEILRQLKGSLTGKGNESLLEKIEAGISLQNPMIRKETFTKIASMFKKNVVQIRFKDSQKLVAQADIGIEVEVWEDGKKVKRELRTQTIEKKGKDGKVRKHYVSECVLPLGALPRELEEDVRKRIDNGEEVLLTAGDALAFRIPSSELHSAVSLRVVDFLNPMMQDGKLVNSNMIILSNELMPIMGHDFDIDSFFVLQKQKAKDKNGRVYYPGYTKNEGVWEFNNDFSTEDLTDEEFEAFHLNQIIEAFQETIEDPENYKRMLSPISVEPFKQDIEEIRKITGKPKPDFDISDPLQNYNAHESSFAGAKGVGVIANAMKAIAYAIRSNGGKVPGMIYREMFGVKEKQITVDGVLIDKIDEGKEEDINLWMSLDALLNAAVDNVKEQVLPQLNIGDNTFKSYIAARAMGVPMKTANRFMVQPFMINLSSIGSSYEVRTLVEKLIKAGEIEKVESIDLNQEELEKWLRYASENGIDSVEKIIASGNKEFIEFQAKMAAAYQQLTAFGDAISDLSGYLSIIREIPVTITEMRTYLERRKKIIDEDGLINERFRMVLPDFLEKNPHVQRLDNVLMEYWSKIKTIIPIHSDLVSQHLKEVLGSIQMNSSDVETLSRLEEEFETFILHIAEDNPDYKWDPEFEGYEGLIAVNPRTGAEVYGKEAFTFLVEEMVGVLKNELPSNKFLSALSSTVEFTGPNISMHGVHNMDFEDILEMRFFFEKLSEYSYNADNRTIVKREDGTGFSNIQKNLLRFAILRYGLKFGTKNFALCFSPELLKPVDDAYVKAISDASLMIDSQRDFLVQMSLANKDLLRPNIKKPLGWTGYNSDLKVHHDLRLEDPNSPDIIRKDNDLDQKSVKTSLFVKVFKAEGFGAYYQEIGSEPQNWYYQKPSETDIAYRFRPDVKHFKVNSLETDENGNVILRRSYKDSSGAQILQPGSTVSISTYRDMLRSEKKYYKVLAIEDTKMTLEETEDVPEPDQLDVLTTTRIDAAEEKSEGRKALIRVLDSLSRRTGLKYELYSEEKMKERFGKDGLKGHIEDGVVYINSDFVTSDTPFHEFIHPFMQMVKEYNPELYAALVEEMKNDINGRIILERVQKNYSEMSPEDQDMEAVVQLAGEYAARTHQMQTKSSLRKLLDRVLTTISTFVRELIGSKQKITKDTLKDLKIGDLTLKGIGLIYGKGTNEIDFGGIENRMPGMDQRSSQIVADSEGLQVDMAPDGKEGDTYTHTRTGKKFRRVTEFIGNWIDRAVNKDISIAQRKADRMWGETDHSVALDTDLSLGEPLTYDEYVKKLDGMFDKGRIKGKIIHKKIQMLLDPANADRYKMEIAQLNQGGIVNSWEYSWVEDNFKELMLKYNINIGAEIPQDQRDVVTSEVTVAVEELGFAGTIDMLVEHPDGTFSIIDWKSGKAFNDKIFHNLMKYGDQKIDITDNVKERAKLQVALYAVMLKMKYPDIQFRDLQVAWIPNEFQALKPNPTSFVEVDSYIPMIEAFFNDKKALKDAGIDENILEKLGGGSKLFRVSEYSAYHSASIADMVGQGKSLDQILAIKLQRLTSIQASLDLVGGAFKNLDKEDKEEYYRLTEEILELEKDPSIALQNSLDPERDISMWTRWFGNAADVNNPMIAVWNKMRNDRAQLANIEYYDKMNKFRALLAPVLKELGVSKVTNFGNYQKIFSWAYVYDDIPGRGKVRRFLHEDDAGYASLSDAKKKLLDYTNSTIGSYFAADGFLNDVVTEIDGKKGKERLTHLDVVNRFTADRDKLKLYKGFMPKVQMTQEEYMYKVGNGSLMTGALSLKNLKRNWSRTMSFYEEKNYEKWDVNEQALPIKYTGSPEIEGSEDYTLNMELIFSRWVQHMEHKKNMDHVYALGKGIYNLMTEKPSKPVLQSTAAILDDILVKDVQGRMKRSKSFGKPFMIKTARIAKVAKDGEEPAKELRWDDKEVSMDKVLMFLTRWGSSVMMQFRPITATGNTIHGMIVEGRRALGSSIALKFQGTVEEELDYTVKDMARAEAEYVKFVKDAAMGNVRSNKLYMIAKQLNYHPNASMYSQNREFISMRNRLMDESTNYIFHTVGEEYLAYILLAAQLHHIKLKDGKSLLDAYQVEKGPQGEPTLVWTGGLRGYTRVGSGIATREIPLEGLTSQEAAKLKRVYEKQQGSYRREELAAMEVYAMGKFFTSLKRYLHRILFEGFQSMKPDYAHGAYFEIGEKEGMPIYEWRARLVEGRFRVLAKHTLALFTAGNVYNEYTWKNMSTDAKTAMIDAVLTLGILAVNYTAYIAMFNDDDDTDTWKKFWKRYLVDNPTQIYNPVDIIRNPAQLVPVGLTRLSIMGGSAAQMISAVALYGVTGDTEKLLTQRGALRGWNDFRKGIPYIAPAADFIGKMQNQDIFNIWDEDDQYRM